MKSFAVKWLRHPVLLSGILLIVVVLTVGAWGSFTGFWSSTVEPENGEQADSSAAAGSQNQIVSLSPGLLKNAHLHASPIEIRAIRDLRTIPGRMQYNQTKHIALRAPTDGMLNRMAAKPGDSVEPGGLLAEFYSPAIGLARAEVLKLKTELDLASRRWDWEQKVVANTEDLIELLSGEPDAMEVEKVFKTRILGQSRETLMSAYSRYRLADQLLTSTQSIQNAGVIPTKTLQERTANQRMTEAAFQAVTEQVLFDARQSAVKAESEYKNAQNQLEIGRQKLATLLGYADKDFSGTMAKDLSSVELRSPIAGTVEELLFAPNERVTQGESLLTVADTKTLWVTAEIRDGDWSALSITLGDTLIVQTPALPDETLKAKVVYIGREVSGQSHALPLFAEIDNSGGQLRPGMFVRVKVPLGQPKDVLAVSPDSLMQHEGKTFVFSEAGTGRYERLEVATGMETPEWVEVKHGLKPGQRIVDKGAFLLKSELLLEEEE